MGNDETDIKTQISRAVDASPSLRGRKDLIEAFLDTVTDTGADIDEQWRAFIVDRRNQELESVIATLKLKPEETRAFMHNAFRDDQLRTGGTEINAVMRPVSRFGGGNRNQVKKDTVETLSAFFERFSGL